LEKLTTEQKQKVANGLYGYLSSTGTLMSFTKTFELLCEIHGEANKLVDGKSFSEMTPENLRLFCLALIAETIEFMNEFNWKEWKTNLKIVDNDKVVSEFGDIIAFVGTLIVLLNEAGYSPHALAMAYIAKEANNVKRFIEKY